MQKTPSQRIVEYSIVEMPLLSHVVIGHTASGVCVISFLPEARGLRAYMTNLFPNSREIEKSSLTEEVAGQLAAYCSGTLQNFSFPLDLQGTSFRKRVWQQLLTIPYGTTVAYADVAEGIDNPKGVRAVAQACGANAVAIVVPCHRVIGKDGSLTGYTGGLHYKKMLLELEGVL